MPTSRFFDDYKKLNPQQKQAVDAIEGPVMVVAGPGTGKTQILTLRIANILIKTQINPENILALTFSDSAARQMRQRLTEIIGTPAYRVEITTFHSFANSIIQNFPEEFNNLLSSVNISEVEQIEIIENILLENEFEIIKPFGEPLYYVKKLIDSINDLKKEGISSETFENSLNESLSDWENISDLYHDKGRFKGEMKGKYSLLKREIDKGFELLKVYKQYQKKLSEQRKYDFNDMLIEVIKVLQKNKRLLLLLQEKYQYFLVDEHQDTNAAQNKIIELLASFHGSPNLFVVGDEKQAIFRFQGASLENFFYFKKLYPDAKLINLTQNYRSQQLILDASHSVIQNNLTSNIIFKTAVKLEAAIKKTHSKIKLLQAEIFFEEFASVAQIIESKIKDGVKPSEIAVLGRNNKDLLEVRDFLDKYNIPSSLISDNDLLSDKTVQKLILLFKVIHDPLDEAGLVKAMHVKSLQIDPFDIYRLLSSSKKDRVNFFENLISLKKKDVKKLDLESFSKIKEFLKILKNWQKISVNEGMEKLFVAVFEDSMLKDEVLHIDKNYESLGKINSLFGFIKEKAYLNPKFSLDDFLRFLKITEEHNLPIRVRGQVFDTQNVKLMTAHKSKGLEFDTVFIIQAYNGHWGNKRKIGASFKLPWDKLGIKVAIEEDENEDERRLFYVAMTRARDDIFVSFSKLALDGKEQLPSQFISEIKPELIEYLDIKPNKKIEDLILTQFDPDPVSSKNVSILKTLFSERGLSISGLQNYLECPWKWFFRSLLLLPDVKTPSQIYGAAIHISLNNYLKAIQIGTARQEDLTNSFRNVVEKEYLSEVEKKRMVSRGEKVLINFHDQIAKNWKKGLLGEMVVKGVKLQENLILNGRIDLIEALEKETIVHDFKTGKIKSRKQIDGSNPLSKYNYLRQLVFYKLLLDQYRNGFFKVNTGVIDFVEPDEKGRIKSEIFEIKKSDVRELEEQIHSVGNQILNLSFWDQNCGEKDCQWCKLRLLMN